MSRWSVGVGLVLALLTAGCASVVSGVPSSAGSGFPSSASAVPLPVPTQTQNAGSDPSKATWIAGIDPTTNVRFQLPGHPKLQTRTVQGANGDTLNERIYQVAYPTLAISVGTLRDPTGPVTWNLDKYASSLVTQFTSVGATDATILNKAHVTIQGHAAITFRFSFTSLTAEKKKAVWLITAIDGGSDLILLQTVGFAVDPSTLLPLATTVERRLVAELSIP